MEYKVVPFKAFIKNKETTAHSAAQLEEIIISHAEKGWTYIRLESVSTFVNPKAGCFGLGGTPGFTTSHQMIVFKKG